MSDINSKVDAILTSVTGLRKDFDVHATKMETTNRDVQEVRSHLWGDNGLSKQVLKHQSSIDIGKWLAGIIGGAAILAIVNSILHIVVK